jgi:hypothetical protein
VIVSLEHGYLVLQVNVPANHNFSVELTITDELQSTRRIVISSVINSKKITPSQASLPLYLDGLYDKWLNFVIDLSSVSIGSFKKDFTCLNSISIGGPHVKIRKVFTVRQKPESLITLGNSTTTTRNQTIFTKSLDFPVGVAFSNVVINCDADIAKLGLLKGKVTHEEMSEAIEDTSKTIDRPKKFVLTKPKSQIPNQPLPKYFKPKLKPSSAAASILVVGKDSLSGVEHVKEKKPRVPKFTPVKRRLVITDKKPSVPLNNTVVDGARPKLKQLSDDFNEFQDEYTDQEEEHREEDDEEENQESVILENEENDYEIQQIIEGSHELLSSASKLLEELKLEAGEYIKGE